MAVLGRSQSGPPPDQILDPPLAPITKVPFDWLDISSNVSMGCQKFSVCVPIHGMHACQITLVPGILSCSYMPTSYYPEYLSQTAYTSYSLCLPTVHVSYISRII